MPSLFCTGTNHKYKRIAKQAVIIYYRTTTSKYMPFKRYFPQYNLHLNFNVQVPSQICYKIGKVSPKSD